jgi:3-hydroxyisobutyrate dehydrogenase
MIDKPKAGIIGLGLMGNHMARNLLKAGYDLTVHNRSRSIVEQLAQEGARPATSPAEVAAASSYVVTSLPGPLEVESVYLRPHGIIEGVQPGAVLIDTSTIDPGLHRRIAAAAAEKGAGYLDAPVSGGPGGARDGTLSIMVGGAAETLEKARPLLEVLGQNIYYMGPVGTGAIIKLVNNMLLAINCAGVCEGLVLAAKAGLDPAQVVEVISNSSGTSRMFVYGAPSVLKRDFSPGFMVDSLHKDVYLALALGRELGVRLLEGSQASQVLEEARSAGFGRNSIFAQILPLEANAGVQVGAKA